MSEEMGVNNNGICLDGIEIEDDIGSERGGRSPASLRGSFEMDRDWMSANRLTVKYREGVDFFLEFSAKNADNPDLVHCPCLKCGNMERMKIAQIREHLFKNGTLTMDDPDDYDDDFALWGQAIGGESESDPAAPELEPGPDSQPKKKNGRGAYKGLKHIKNRSEGILLKVEYNQWGQCIGDTANELVSQIGLYARRNLPLTYNDWRKVPIEFCSLAKEPNQHTSR
ncbi:hypothetical protein G4B88_017070 [Cannabis sativa]|uniref:Transposase-associated domain-containing protein n=1 Tax=Cannabis sativa TaxID=3483 RepID=A0A7J6DTZ7_CANSA|nr:hypothetical protein G4B88_017070 [Cannabis sativa]